MTMSALNRRTRVRNRTLATVAGSLLLATAAVAAEGDADTDFRRGRWGDSPQAVEKAESLEVAQRQKQGDVSVLVYEGEIAGLAAEIAYLFNPEGLYQGIYKITEDHADHALYIADFEKLRDLLSEKYGEPASSGTRWTNELFKGNPDHWDEALIAGHVSWAATWVTERTKVSIALFGQAFRVRLGITYESQVDAAEREAAEKEKALDDL